jgi:hypothetical protein
MMSVRGNKYPLLNRWRDDNKITDDIRFVGFVNSQENKIWHDPSWEMSNTRFNKSVHNYVDDKDWRHARNIEPPSVECNTPQFNHSFTLSTSYSMSNKEYIDVEKVFIYVTLGATLTKQDMNDVREWVRRSVDSFNRTRKNKEELENIYIRVSRPFDGKDDVYQVKRYMPEHYPAIAKACINWAVANNNKLIYPIV